MCVFGSYHHTPHTCCLRSVFVSLYKCLAIQWNLYNETGKLLIKTHKFHHLPVTIFTKSCLFSLPWKTTCLERPQSSAVDLYRLHCIMILHSYFAISVITVPADVFIPNLPVCIATMVIIATASGIRHGARPSAERFLRYIHSSVENECCCLCTTKISNANLTNQIQRGAVITRPIFYRILTKYTP